MFFGEFKSWKRLSELMAIFQVKRATIYDWFNAFEQRSFAGLY